MEVAEIGSGSEWQNGKDWMCLSISSMPLRTIKDINLSREDKRLASQETKTPIMYNDLPELVPKVTKRYRFSNYVVDPNKYGWESGVRIVAYILKFLSLLKPN